MSQAPVIAVAAETPVAPRAAAAAPAESEAPASTAALGSLDPAMQAAVRQALGQAGVDAATAQVQVEQPQTPEWTMAQMAAKVAEGRQGIVQGTDTADEAVMVTGLEMFVLHPSKDGRSILSNVVDGQTFKQAMVALYGRGGARAYRAFRPQILASLMAERANKAAGKGSPVVTEGVKELRAAILANAPVVDNDRYSDAQIARMVGAQAPAAAPAAASVMAAPAVKAAVATPQAAKAKAQAIRTVSKPLATNPLVAPTLAAAKPAQRIARGTAQDAKASPRIMTGAALAQAEMAKHDTAKPECAQAKAAAARDAAAKAAAAKAAKPHQPVTPLKADPLAGTVTSRDLPASGLMLGDGIANGSMPGDAKLLLGLAAALLAGSAFAKRTLDKPKAEGGRMAGIKAAFASQLKRFGLGKGADDELDLAGFELEPRASRRSLLRSRAGKLVMGVRTRANGLHSRWNAANEAAAAMWGPKAAAEPALTETATQDAVVETAPKETPMDGFAPQFTTASLEDTLRRTEGADQIALYEEPVKAGGTPGIVKTATIAGAGLGLAALLFAATRKPQARAALKLQPQLPGRPAQKLLPAPATMVIA